MGLLLPWKGCNYACMVFEAGAVYHGYIEARMDDMSFGIAQVLSQTNRSGGSLALHFNATVGSHYFKKKERVLTRRRISTASTSGHGTWQGSEGWACGWRTRRTSRSPSRERMMWRGLLALEPTA